MEHALALTLQQITGSQQNTACTHQNICHPVGGTGAAGGFVTVMVPDLLPADDEMRGLYTMECTSLNEVLAKLKTGEL